MPKKVFVKPIVKNGPSYVQEGTIWTRPAFQQWFGWSSERSYRHRPGLRDQYRKAVDDVTWMTGYIRQMIEAELTYKSYDGASEKVIDEYDEERFIEDLEDLRDHLNSVLNEMGKRRPLQRRIELMQRILDPSANAGPGEVAAARAGIERLKRRLGTEDG